MADPAVVSTAKGVAGAGLTVATDTTISIAAGNGLMVTVHSQNQTTQTITGVATVANPTGWFSCAAVTDGNGNFNQIWYKPNATAEAVATVVATWSASIGESGISVIQGSGLALDSTMLSDQKTGMAVSVTTVTSPSMSAPRAALIVAAVTNNGSNTWTPDNGATEVLDSQTQYVQASANSHYRAVAAGSYTAGSTANASFGFAAIAAAVFVGLPPPVITSQPLPQTVYAGQAATFTIAATGTGTLHYQWKDDGANVGTDSAAYTPTTVLSDNGSIIACVVTDDNGSTTSSTATLFVLPTSSSAWIAA
jgi:hypothetical protein